MIAKILLLATLLFSTVSHSATETVEMIPVTNKINLETTIYKPDSSGPFPLIVINHGKAPIHPSKHNRVRYARLANEFLKRGYAVIVPMRQAFSKSTGQYSEWCDLAKTGLSQAGDIRLILDYFTKLDWVDENRMIVAGQSYGGLATMAFGSQDYPGVRGTINFSGGLKWSSGCDWERELVIASFRYGATAKINSIWFYGTTDTFFGPKLALSMRDAYVANGAPLTFINNLSCEYTNDSHYMIGWSDGVSCYWPDTEKFLINIGMPYQDLSTGEALIE